MSDVIVVALFWVALIALVFGLIYGFYPRRWR